MDRAERVLRSPVLSGLILLATATFIAFRWGEADWSVLSSVDAPALVLAGAAYACLLVALPLVATVRPRLDVLLAGVEAQLHKYIPGMVWQAQPLISVGGFGLATSFAWATLLTACLAIAAGASGWLTAISIIGALGLLAVSVWKRGWRQSTVSLAWSALAVLALLGSGAAVGAGLGFDLLPTGRAVASSWGLGVIAVPVPSGLGVREASLTIMLAEEGAPVAAVHRLITLSVDVGLGLAALALRRRSRHHNGATPPGDT